ncbi:MAG: SpoVG family protein [Candidatus Omnitrophica bacterium]|nr:SpoVG family protein [Candidatus Omnitrophota bacterium]MCF7892523.1 SpoVG family protein [Candidatus Omnitrophota bacterium]MCF7895682.1 SpoVG family protein [Candidatus Omnitrophota bacterium]MCF7898022.1 SpoVG family protein [Candidatus Omnitrophota bacterium]
MNKLEISEIQIIPVKPKDGLIAFCSFILNDQFYIGDIAIYTRPDGKSYRLVYPTKKLSNGKTVSCIHPIDKYAGDIVTEKVIKTYRQLLSRSDEIGEDVS